MSRAHARGPLSIVKNNILNVAPPGTKAYILNLGYLEADLGFFFQGGNASLLSHKIEGTQPERERKQLIMYGVLIDHPSEGLIIWEVGPGKPGWEDRWAAGTYDAFCRVNPDTVQELDKAIADIGYDIKDIKHIIMGHLHMDHGGGLEYFKGRKDIQIWVSEAELKYAFWGMATGHDDSCYFPYYLDLEFKWNTFKDETVELFPGITIHFAPGHTPGLSMMQLNLEKEGTFIFTSDHCYFEDNYAGNGQQLGWLMRDNTAWYNSTQKLRRLQGNTNGTVVFGHDIDCIKTLLKEKPYLE